MSDFSALVGFQCVTCEQSFGPDEVLYTCPRCGPLDGTLDARYDVPRLQAKFGPKVLRERPGWSVWRYHEMLPISKPEARLHVPVGLTPFYGVPAPLLAGLVAPSPEEPPEELPARLWIKDDTRLPSGSTKDRATVMAVARARELGMTVIAAASTGNAASSLASLAAPAGLCCIIFAPAGAPEAKLVQIRIHGAKLFAVHGTYDEAFDLCWNVCQRTRMYNRNTAVNPVLAEGKKTIALEIWEQLGYRAPEVVVVPVGDGCILSGVAKGFRDLLDLGWIERLPRLIGVQAEGSAALATAWRGEQARCRSVVASTVADSISVSQPRDQVKALRRVRESGGAFVVVSDEAILRGMNALASRLGLFAEPAAASVFAGLRQGLHDRVIKPEEEVVLVVTGHGLKDIVAARRAAEGNPPIPVGPNPDDAERLVRFVEDGWNRFGTPR